MKSLSNGQDFWLHLEDERTRLQAALELNRPLAHGATPATDKTMFFEHQGNQAARIGHWKLVRRYSQEWELYNLEEDPTELNNLINKRAEKADSLKTMFNQWADKCGVRPWPVKKKK